VLPALKRATMLLSRLPGVGEKTAQRYLFHLLTETPELCAELGAALSSLHDVVGACVRCGNFADKSSGEAVCDVCADPKRDPKLLCVVGKVQDLLAIERTSAMRGRYFVLGKLLSPLDGVGPESLPLPALRRRIEAEGIEELIVATPPSVEGEATALFLKRELAKDGLRLSRIASGVPHGGDLEFADPITMGRALEGRKSL
jgi:recombination protein RecR